MQDLNIFDDSYFEPADEDVITALTVTNFTLWVINRISKILARQIKNKAVLVDYDKMIKKGVPENIAKRETSKTVKFLISHRYVEANITPKSTKVNYSDLTDTGKEYIDKYYIKIGKIDEFTIKKAVEAKSSKLETASSVSEFVNILLQILMNILGGDILGCIITTYDGFEIGTFIEGFLNKLNSKKSDKK